MIVISVARTNMGRDTNNKIAREPKSVVPITFRACNDLCYMFLKYPAQI